MFSIKENGGYFFVFLTIKKICVHHKENDDHTNLSKLDELESSGTREQQK